MGPRRVGGVVKKKAESSEDESSEEEVVQKRGTRGGAKAPAKATAKKASTPAESKIETEEKESVKNPPKKGKVATQQEQILQKIENENTSKHIQELCDKFEPPECAKCPNRNADRICVSADCGHDNYLELICGKCHIAKHAEQKEKPELDVEEFFVKLGTFLNDSRSDASFAEQGIDVEKLQGAFAQIEAYEAQLNEIEAAIRREITGYKSPEEIENHMADCITKALSDPTFENIEEQLGEIKSCVLFEDNKFRWNGVSEKAKYLRDQVNLIRDENKELKRVITSSFVGGKMLDLDEIEFEKGVDQGYGNAKKSAKITRKNGAITFQTMAKSYQNQYYLEFPLDPSRKYTMRFTVNQFNHNYFFIGVMSKAQVKTYHIHGGQSGFFFKRFYNASPTQDCSKVLRGSEFGQQVVSGNQYEMRVSIEDQVLEFLTYPEYENAVSKLDSSNFDPSTEYVIVFSVYNNIGITIDSLEESFFFPSY